MDKKSKQDQSVIRCVATGFGRVSDFFQSTGPMLIGLVVGAILGGVAAVFVGFPFFASVLIGAAVGFLLVILVQALLIGGG